MRTSNYRKRKISRKAWKGIATALTALCVSGMIFFFIYFKVENVEVMGNIHYSEGEVREMVLRGPLASNAVLAPLFYTQKEVEGIPFVAGYSVTMINRNTICISVKEEKPVGCIPYLDSYIYFDRRGVFIESSRTRDESVPYFDGITVKHVILDEKLPIKGSTILNTAVALATIFQKNERIPDHIVFDENYQISLLYGDITVLLGRDEYLEDKMMRAIAILPMISGRKGLLHLESVTDVSKMITFEEEQEEITAENWPGGYEEDGEYTGTGEYDENGKHVGPRPKSELDYALEAWPGGYDIEGDYTGAGEYDESGNYIGPAPTQESLDANGDWKGGYTEDGIYTGTGEYDRNGEYLGPKPEIPEEETEEEVEENSSEEAEENPEEWENSGEEEISWFEDEDYGYMEETW